MGRQSKLKHDRRQVARTQATEKARTFQRVALATWFVVACVLITAGAYSHFSRPVRVKLGATLGSFDRLQLSYGGRSKDYISPICGCWNEQKAETWRGISFAARRLTLSRSGPSPLTAYVVTAPWPAEIFAGGPWLALPSKTFGPVISSFDPATVLEQFKAQALPASNSNITTRVQYAVLVSDKPLHIQQFGETPFGAWIPTAASTVTIRPQFTMFASSANIVEVQESYERIRTGTPRKARTLDTIGSADLDDRQSNAEVPALDLIGKRTVLWSDGAQASVWLSEHSDNSSSHVGRTGSAVGLVIDPAFSARVAVIPTTREALARFAKIEQEQLLPQPQDWLTVSERGAVSLRVERTPEELAEFDRIAQRIRAHDAVERVAVDYPRALQIADSGQDVFMYEPRMMSFRYPPAPPARGFNVFGTMTHLSFEGALGSVVVGSRNIDISAPSTLEFRDIESFKAARGLIPIAVGGSSDVQNTTLTFSGVSEGWVNGDPLTRVSDRLSWSLGLFQMLTGIVSAIAAAYGMAVIVFTHREDGSQ